MYKGFLSPAIVVHPERPNENEPIPNPELRQSALGNKRQKCTPTIAHPPQRDPWFGKDDVPSNQSTFSHFRDPCGATDADRGLAPGHWPLGIGQADVG